MIEYNVIQGSEEWFKLRLGTATASTFSKLISPKGKISSQIEGLANELIAECITGHEQEFSIKTAAMQRGNDLEPEAVECYEEESGYRTKIVGIITTEDGRFAVSPDRFVGKEGLLEVKCPLQSKHTENLIKGVLDDTYKPQVQGQMLLTDRKWCDFMSYHPEMPPLIVRCERDEPFIATLQEAMDELVYNMDMKIWRLREHGVKFQIKKALRHDRNAYMDHLSDNKIAINGG